MSARADAIAIRVARATPEEAARLQKLAERLDHRSLAAGEHSDLALARSEAIWAVLAAQADLEHAEAELEPARTQLAEAVAALDPVAADLARVRSELAATSVEGTLDERIGARMRRAALEAELEPLEEQVRQLESPVALARNLLVSLERDTVPHYRAVLRRAEAALKNPPIHDLGRLADVAPETTSRRAFRVGALMLDPDQVRTDHGRQVASAHEAQLKASGLWFVFKDTIVSELLRDLPRDLAASVTAALAAKARDDALPPAPNDYAGITAESLAKQAAQGAGFVEIDPVTGEPPGPTLDRFPTINANAMVGPGGLSGSQLPAYDSPAGAQLRAADQAQRSPRYRGPADWPQ